MKEKSLRNRFLLRLIEKSDYEIKYHYEVEGMWKKIFTSKTLQISYSRPIKKCNDSVACVPLLCNILPIVWLYNAEVEVPELDKDFYECIADVKKGYEDMYPMLEFKGEIKTQKLVLNTIERCDKSACLFSGGVDAFSTLISHFDEKPMLVTLWGADISSENIEGWKVIDEQIKRTADDWKLERIGIKTLFREFINEQLLNADFMQLSGDDWWHGFQHGIGILGHVAPLAYCYNISKIYIASSFTRDDKGKVTCASDPSIDNHLCFFGCKVIHDGYEMNRQMKIRNICNFRRKTKFPVELRVCYETTEGTNCCQCEKCTRTMLGIMAEEENPLLYGFSYTIDELKNSMKNFRDIALGKKCANRSWRESSYKIIQETFKRNYTEETMPEYLKWFWNYDTSLLRKTDKQKKFAQIYIDYGQGFSEGNSEKFLIENNDINILEFHVPEKAISLRFDPCNVVCRCKIYDFVLDGESNQEVLVPLNRQRDSKESDLFLSTDPQYIVQLPFEKLSGKTIKIEFWYKELFVTDMAIEYLEMLNEKDNEIKKLQEKLRLEHSKKRNIFTRFLFGK